MRIISILGLIPLFCGSTTPDNQQPHKPWKKVKGEIENNHIQNPKRTTLKERNRDMDDGLKKWKKHERSKHSARKQGKTHGVNEYDKENSGY